MWCFPQYSIFYRVNGYTSNGGNLVYALQATFLGGFLWKFVKMCFIVKSTHLQSCPPLRKKICICYESRKRIQKYKSASKKYEFTGEKKKLTKDRGIDAILADIYMYTHTCQPFRFWRNFSDFLTPIPNSDFLNIFFIIIIKKIYIY